MNYNTVRQEHRVHLVSLIANNLETIYVICNAFTLLVVNMETECFFRVVNLILFIIAIYLIIQYLGNVGDGGLLAVILLMVMLNKNNVFICTLV